MIKCSVYYWSGMLSPPKYAPLAAYVCGWFNFVGNVGGTAAFASGFASIINAAVVLNNPIQNVTDQYGINDVPNSLSINNKIQTAIAIGIVTIWTLQNILRIDQQG
ncbi:unnamed protein product [Didymodactylos carnosus]|uniref:Uncharacterized protein n=1 Tax=Didymodactylos carnosus TaxID=1234261 RepID=A0A8S2VCV3_9BILA|nr:unnamed protein product [Didymodactylos carnosus]CAF4378186.1 unnamed protein product [Didymodactylos carnosus]